MLILVLEKDELHAIKKIIDRPYLSVRNRIRAITMPEDVLKGREFEDFVLELFDMNEANAYSLLEWRSDKSTREISPVSNTYPDFVLEYRGGRKKVKFSVECKWRSFISQRMTKPIITPEQLARYKEYSVEKKQDVFIILGVGGEPSMPDDLYIIPINSFAQIQSKPSLLGMYKRDKVSKWFSIEEFKR